MDSSFMNRKRPDLSSLRGLNRFKVRIEAFERLERLERINFEP